MQAYHFGGHSGKRDIGEHAVANGDGIIGQASRQPARFATEGRFPDGPRLAAGAASARRLAATPRSSHIVWNGGSEWQIGAWFVTGTSAGNLDPAVTQDAGTHLPARFAFRMPIT